MFGLILLFIFFGYIISLLIMLLMNKTTHKDIPLPYDVICVFTLGSWITVYMLLSSILKKEIQWQQNNILI